ncbi:MAG: FkbM family methyltransferase [Rhodospirillales bacterium]
MPRFNPMRWNVPLLKRLVPGIRRRRASRSATRGFTLGRSGAGLFLLQVGNFVDRQVAFYDDYESAQIDFLLAAIRRERCELFVDVGANFGYYAVRVALETEAPHVVAVECDPRNFDQLRANLFLNGLSERVETHALALGERAGNGHLALAPATHTGQTALAPHDAGRPVAVAALDDLLNPRGARVAVKIDVEGHERRVLAGMRRLLALNRCVLQIESFPGQAAGLAADLAAQGYAAVHRVGDDHFFMRHGESAAAAPVRRTA